jgi:hypothetical protein
MAGQVGGFEDLDLDSWAIGVEHQRWVSQRCAPSLLNQRTADTSI